MTDASIGRVVGLWRFPVKSMSGCPERGLEIDRNGVRGDRGFAVRDLSTGVVLSHDSAPLLLHVAVRSGGADQPPELLIPGRVEWLHAPEARAALSTYLAREVEVVERAALRAELSFDYGLPVRNEPDQGFGDVAAVVHVVSTASIAWLNERDNNARVPRPNLVLDVGDVAFREHTWVGQRIVIGDAVLVVTEVTERCSLLNQSQPGLAADPENLRRVQTETGGGLGVYASIQHAGSLRLGESVAIRSAT